VSTALDDSLPLGQHKVLDVSSCSLPRLKIHLNAKWYWIPLSISHRYDLEQSQLLSAGSSERKNESLIALCRDGESTGSSEW
jgi:hypothetical protein